MKKISLSAERFVKQISVFVKSKIIEITRMETLNTFINVIKNNLPIVITIIGLLFTYIIYRRLAGSLTWLKFRMNFPIFGRISRLSNNFEYESDGWFSSENNICNAFSEHHYDKVDKQPEFYDNCNNYLSKVQELGRTSLPVWLLIIIVLMVFIESLGFSYVLAGYTIPGSSEALKQKGSVGIAILISLILVFVMHFVGRELHKNSLLKMVSAWHDPEEGRKRPRKQITIEQDSIDDDDPVWKQLFSRINKPDPNAQPTYKTTIFGVLLIILVATGATYVRGQVLNQELAEQHMIDETNYTTYTSDDPYAKQLPTELQDSQEEVDKEVDSAIEIAKRKGGWATFIVLAVIFVALQLLGILFGMRYDFAGSESAKAYRFTKGFDNRDQFNNFLESKRNYVANMAQQCLESLQGKLVKNANKKSINPETIKRLSDTSDRTFLTYVTQSTHAKDNAAISDAKSKSRKENKINTINIKQETQTTSNDSKDTDILDILTDTQKKEFLKIYQTNPLLEGYSKEEALALYLEKVKLKVAKATKEKASSAFDDIAG